MEHKQIIKQNLKTDYKKISPCHTSDLVCFSHLRWNFVYQRPQHLLSRFAKYRRVFYFEEPVYEDLSSPELRITHIKDKLFVAVPHLPKDLDQQTIIDIQRYLLDEFYEAQSISSCTLWYYTPLALAFTNHIKAEIIVYDCMDELSAFKFAPPEILTFETKLFKKADIVFTGGQSLYESKKHRHHNIHAFPSSIDAAHFLKARSICSDPADQKDIPHPRLGFFGVIDERMDIHLLDGLAKERPDWHLVMIGPVVKISPNTLPKHPNIHYLGMKDYEDLPSYISGWNVAMLPFARNESTRFISPTKTPEYLTAGRPVVSTSIRDVIRPYGERGMVEIADSVSGFIRAVEKVMERQLLDQDWFKTVDVFLSNNSWDKTWQRMADLEKKQVRKSLDWNLSRFASKETRTGL